MVSSRWAYALPLIAVVLAAGCSGPTGGETRPTVGIGTNSPSKAGTESPAGCVESPRFQPDHAMNGSAENGELWALGGGARVGEEFKLVVRITGAGEVSAAAISPDGSRHEPLRIERHASSNFQRPGREWGLFFEFDRRGCWQIAVERGDVRGVITMLVKP